MSQNHEASALAGLSKVQVARLRAALEATKSAAARACMEQGAVNQLLLRQQGELEGVQEAGRKLLARGRDIRNSLQILREAVDRAKLTALNAGLEGARLGNPIGRALVVMGDELRNLLARAIDALEEHGSLLAEVDRDRDRCLSELARLTDASREGRRALASAEQQTQLTRALLGELGTDLAESLGGDAESARMLAETAAQVKTTADSLLALIQRSPTSAEQLRELLSPLLRLLQDEARAGAG